MEGRGGRRKIEADRQIDRQRAARGHTTTIPAFACPLPPVDLLLLFFFFPHTLDAHEGIYVYRDVLLCREKHLYVLKYDKKRWRLSCFFFSPDTKKKNV